MNVYAKTCRDEAWLIELDHPTRAKRLREAATEIERLEGEIKEWERVEVGKRHELKKLRDERNKLQDALDMARDEFQRIICLNPGPEITGLCLRGKLGVERAVPLIQSYIKLESENQRLREAIISNACSITDCHDPMCILARELKSTKKGAKR